MCGIAGILGSMPNGSLDKMLSRIAHRGPDGIGRYCDEQIQLGHVRLAIIDPSLSAGQPMWDSSGRFCIVFNGEIYNFRELRSELIELGYTFITEGDTEVLLHLYVEYGKSMLGRLRGIFAFAIYDLKSNNLFIARDQFGVKPLYYTWIDGCFVFASEVKSFLDLKGFMPVPHYPSIYRTLIFQWNPGPETVFHGVYCVPSGHYVEADMSDGFVIKPYWEWPRYNPKDATFEVKLSELDSLMVSSVVEQSISDVPIGSFLSGGVDSSLICSIFTKLSRSKLPTYTIDNGDLDIGFGDDRFFAHKVADLLDIPCANVSLEGNFIEQLEKMVYNLDELCSDIAPLNVAAISAASRRAGVKVLFSGAGGDDIFSGYRRHFVARYSKFFFNVFFRKLVRISNTIISVLPNTAFKRRIHRLSLMYDRSDNMRILSYFFWFDPEVVFELFNESVKKQLKSPFLSLGDIIKEINDLDKMPELEKVLHLDRKYFLTDHNLLYTDKMSMAEGVEVRVPFLDVRLADFSAGLNVRLKQSRSKGKFLLKKLAEKYLPREVVHRSKTGFGFPLKKWVDDSLGELRVNYFNRDMIERQNCFDYLAVVRVLDEHELGVRDHSYLILSLLLTSLWFDIFVSGKHLSFLSSEKSCDK